MSIWIEEHTKTQQTTPTHKNERSPVPKVGHGVWTLSAFVKEIRADHLANLALGNATESAGVCVHRAGYYQNCVIVS